MLPTFVIGLREGLEAALIVGIIATFLDQQQRRDALRWVWAGVVLAVVLCLGVAVGLEVAAENLPQRQQEGLETVVGLLAVGLVTWMIVWMRRHARALKGDLEDRAAAALAVGSVGTLVVMAFLAVLREGLETAVFLLAAFQASSDPSAAGTGAVLGVVVAAAIGYGIYRGGVKLNLERFFRLTGLVLVLVAAGLLATAAHTAHEAGWLDAGQSQVMNLRWLVDPGSIRSALLTGMLGVQSRPVVSEVVVYIAYLIPMAAYVLWPAQRPVRPRAATATAAVASALVAALVLAGCGSSSDDAAGSGGKGVKTVAIKLVEEGCSPEKLTLPAGPTKFVVSNDDADAVSEFEIMKGKSIVGEVENIPPGLEKSFSMTLQPGEYVTYCPEGTKNDGKGTLTVTGTTVTTKAASSAARARAVTTYRSYLDEQSAQLVSGTQAFVDAVKAGDVAKAKSLYGPARIPYERIEPVAETFGNLDPAIDARDGDVPTDEWGGFHKIEQALWVGNTTAGMEPVADKLLSDTRQLQALVKTVKLEPAAIANGAVELLNEVSSSKVTGEEERYSRTDLIDLAANVEGSKAAFGAVAPLLGSAEPSAATIDARFAALQAEVDKYKRGESYAPYTELTETQTRAISQAVDTVAEPLSKVAERIVA